MGLNQKLGLQRYETIFLKKELLSAFYS